jgi:sulfoxide reductase heme-binding subunit YedZ
MRLRRMLVLFAFFYALHHVITYMASTRDSTAEQSAPISCRGVFFVGFLTFLLLAPLAATSTNSAIRPLGYPRWKRLHRLAYAAPAPAVLHFIWRVKRDISEPMTTGPYPRSCCYYVSRAVCFCLFVLAPRSCCAQ